MIYHTVKRSDVNRDLRRGIFRSGKRCGFSGRFRRLVACSSQSNDPPPHRAMPEPRLRRPAPKSGRGGRGRDRRGETPPAGRWPKGGFFGIVEGENLPVHWAPGRACALLRKPVGGWLGIEHADRHVRLCGHVGERDVQRLTHARETHNFRWVLRDAVKKLRLCT